MRATGAALGLASLTAEKKQVEQNGLRTPVEQAHLYREKQSPAHPLVKSQP
jgi:LPS O-antigen subunit length determinant protein (WzzB/FepE family)